MKYLIPLLLIILLVGCQTIIKKEKTSQDNITKPSQENKPTIQEPQKEPLELTLTADKTEEELELKTTIYCQANKGEENYTYNWNNNCKNNECEVTLNEIGNHTIKCTVSDGKKEITKSITLEVKKQIINIETIIGYGDSLTQGFGLDNPETENWLYQYSQNLEVELINNAHEGDATSDILQTQLKNKIPNKNKLIFLWIGANNILRLESTNKFFEEYNKIVNNLTQIPDSKLILMTIPDASKLSSAIEIEQGINQILGIEIDVKQIGKEIIKNYNDVIWATAEQNNLNTIDMFTYMEDNFNQSLEGPDKFHPNKKGHELIAEKIKKDMQIFYPKKEFK